MLNLIKTKIFADGAEIKDIKAFASNPIICGFTTNPSLMRKAGISNYRDFAFEVLHNIAGKPVAFEVFADDLEEMESQAQEIATWGKNVYIKIPVTNTKGIFTTPIIEKLTKEGVAVNVTAVFTLEQVEKIVAAVDLRASVHLSIFAGRIADTGRDPVPLMEKALNMIETKKNIELLWASPREIYNLTQANSIGCHIITLPPDLLKKMALLNKDLTEYSLETVKMLYQDAVACQLSLELGNNV